MASLLSLAGGASEGLDQVLERMLKQQQVDQQRKQQEGTLAETTRHNTAAEGIQRDQLSSVERDRKEREAETALTHRNAENDRDDTTVTRQIALRPIGSFASPEEKARETAHGAPSGLYDDYQPPNMGRSTETEEVGATPGGFKWRGTEGQQAKVREDNSVAAGRKSTQDNQDRSASERERHDRAMENRPQSPTVSFVQTDKGLTGVDRRTMKGRPVTDEGGGGYSQPDSAQTRNRRDMAEAVGSHFDDAQQLIDEADKRGLLGPMRGRTFNEFMAGKVGSTGNKADDELLGELRTSLSMIRTGTASLHGRSGANVGIAKELEKKMDDGYMDPAQLKGSLKALRSWVDKYASKGKTGADTGGIPEVGGTFQGGKVLSVTPYKP